MTACTENPISVKPNHTSLQLLHQIILQLEHTWQRGHRRDGSGCDTRGPQESSYWVAFVLGRLASTATAQAPPALTLNHKHLTRYSPPLYSVASTQQIFEARDSASPLTINFSDI